MAGSNSWRRLLQGVATISNEWKQEILAKCADRGLAKQPSDDAGESRLLDAECFTIQLTYAMRCVKSVDWQTSRNVAWRWEIRRAGFSVNWVCSGRTECNIGKQLPTRGSLAAALCWNRLMGRQLGTDGQRWVRSRNGRRIYRETLIQRVGLCTQGYLPVRRGILFKFSQWYIWIEL